MKGFLTKYSDFGSVDKYHISAEKIYGSCPQNINANFFLAKIIQLSWAQKLNSWCLIHGSARIMGEKTSSLKFAFITTTFRSYQIAARPHANL
jgi:hypothetical protein